MMASIAGGYASEGHDAGEILASVQLYEDLDVPVVVRHGRSGPAQPAPFDASEIPAFLRKASDDEDAGNDLLRPPYWVDSPQYIGYTPVGFYEWLRRNPKAQHPKNYADLRAAGIGAPLIDWLQQTFGEKGGATVPEADVVAAFIYLMMSDEMLRQLGLPSGVRAAIGAAARRAKAALKGMSKRTPPSRLGTLVEEMQRALAGISAEHWPEAIEPVMG